MARNTGIGIHRGFLRGHEKQTCLWVDAAMQIEPGLRADLLVREQVHDGGHRGCGVFLA
jgi:hypothetical protein